MTSPTGSERQPLIQIVSDLRTSAGTAVTCALILTNVADIPRVMSVTALGVDASWLPRPSRSRALAPGESIQVELTFRPAQGTVPARYPLAVAVQALDPVTAQASSPTAIAELELTVDAPGTIALRLAPQDTTGVFGKKVELLVENSGLQSASVELWPEAAAGLKIALDTYRLDVPAGQTVPVSGRVSSKARLAGSRLRRVYSVEARAGSAPRRVEGSYTSRAMFGSGAIRAVALLALVGIWIAAAIIFIPKLADHAKANRSVTVAGGTSTSSTTSASPSSSPGAPSGSGSSASPGTGGGSGSSGSGGRGGTGAAAASSVQLNGTVAGTSASGVNVELTPTSPINAAQSAESGTDTAGAAVTPLGYSASPLAGKVTADALATAPADVTQNKTTRTGPDGAWTIPAVAKPGYYELTFSKPGYQTVRYIIDSSAPAAGQPLAVSLVPADGRLTGTVLGPGGAAGGAAVTITDGTNTLTTSSATKGSVGTWEVVGLSTPSTYLVTVSKNGLSTESALVSLGAGGTQTVTLRMRSGLISLRGKISDEKTLDGIGGATVTATDGTITRTATAVTKDPVAGNYTLPDLPPGDYTVTFSAPGYQSQTSRMTLKAGQPGLTAAAALLSASGTVRGVVSGGGKGQVGTGLVLSNPTNTYKTTTTSDPTLGGYSFDGVEPGTYTLTAQLFGFATATVSVVVTAGNATVRAVDLQADSTVLASATVTGQVVDSRTGSALTCTACITASTLDHRDPDSTPAQPDVTFQTTISGSESYTLPEAPTDPSQPRDELWPGLHTITISSPGYETTTVKVAVPLSGTVTAPVVRLSPAPILTGTITTAAETSPTGPTCVWAVAAGSSVTAADLACLPGTTVTAGCPAPATWPSGAQCAAPVSGGLPRALGDYTLTVPQQGSYTIYVQSADPEFRTAGGLAVGGATQTLETGQTKRYDAGLHRWGRISVPVRFPGASGVLTPVPLGVTVQVLEGATCDVATPAGLPAGLAGPFQTSSQGVATIFGVNGSYWLKATYNGNTGCVSVAAGLDHTYSADLPLTNPLPNLVGRLVYSLDGQPTPITNATVQVLGTFLYIGTSPLNVEWDVRTDQDGCFAVHSSSSSEIPNVPGCSHLAATFANRYISGNPIAEYAGLNLLSGVVSVTAQAAGFTNFAVPNYTGSGTPAVNVFTMQSGPVAFSGAGSLLHVTPDPGDSTWASQVQVHAAPTTGTASLTVSAVPGASTDTAQLVWNDPALSQNQVRAGSYTLSASLPGYAPASATLTCTPDAGCSMSPDFTLKKLATLVLTTRNSSADDVADAQVTAYDGSTALPAGSQSGAATTFAGLTPGDASISARVQAAGYKFSTASAANYTLACGASLSTVTAVTNIPALTPGQTINCVATLTRLSSITGSVAALNALPPATSPYTTLGDVTVTATLCSDAPVANPDYGVDTCAPAGTNFSAPAADDGTFTLTGSNTVEGLAAGTWLVSASATGYCRVAPVDTSNSDSPTATCPAGPAGAYGQPIVVDGSSASALAAGTLLLWRQPGVLKVQAKNDVGSPATGLTVDLLDGTSTVIATADVGTVSGGYAVYTFPPVIPGTYRMEFSGTDYVSGSNLVTVVSGTGGPASPLTVQRATNSVNGTIITTPFGGVTVCIVKAATDTCSNAIKDLDGNFLTKTNDSADGGYLFTKVKNTPNGQQYYVHAEKYGYVSWWSSPFAVQNTGPSSATMSTTLVRVTRNVEVTVAFPSGDAALAGLSAWTLTPSAATATSGSPDPPTNTAQGPSAIINSSTTSGVTTQTVRFASVPYGCWLPALTSSVLANHFGLSLTRTGAADSDSGLSCTDTEARLVSGVSGGATTVSQAYAAFDEFHATVSSISLGTAPNGMTAPSTVDLVGKNGGTTLFELPTLSLSSGSADLGWVAAGITVALTATLPGGTSPVWTVALSNPSLTSGTGDDSTTLSVTAPTSTVTLTVQSSADASVKVSGASVTLVPPASGYAGYAPATNPQTTDSNGQVVFAGVPYGAGWSVTITPPSGYVTPALNTFDITSAATADTFQLIPTKAVTVTVQSDATGTPAVGGAALTISAPSGFTWYTPPTGITTAADGTAVLTLPYGAGWKVAAAKTGFTGSSATFDVSATAPTAAQATVTLGS